MKKEQQPRSLFIGLLDQPSGSAGPLVVGLGVNSNSNSIIHGNRGMLASHKQGFCRGINGRPHELIYVR